MRFERTLETAPLGWAASARGVPFAVVDVENAALAALYQSPLMLVRPDGHVAWRVDTCPKDALALLDCARGAVTQ